MRLEKIEKGVGIVTRALYYAAGLISLAALILRVAKGLQ